MNMKKIHNVALIVLSVFIVVIVTFFCIKLEKNQNKNYISKEIFENVKYIYHYDDLIRERDKEYQEKVVYNKSGYPLWLVDCGDIKVLYDYDEDREDASYFLRAQTSDSSYLFGEKGIRVGMDRDTAEKILKNAKKPTPDPDSMLIIDDRGATNYQEVFGYYDDVYDYGMGIIYNEDNKISHILLYLGL